MIFSSLTFIFLFLPTIIVVYFFCPKVWVKNGWLCLSSLVLYAIGSEPKAFLILICSLAFNFLCSKWIYRLSRQESFASKIIFIFTIIVDVLILVIYKFRFNIIALVNNEMILNMLKLSVPGISFFSFQEISYIVDINRGNEPLRNPFDYVLYISFFPQLIAGPIIRYHDIARQINQRAHSLSKTNEGLQLFLIGLCKKVLIADTLGEVVNLVFRSQNIESYSTGLLWLSAIAYSLQIYYDFSGYSDMAIGLGKVFGFQIKKNFDYPYVASSITDFWKRWHISLTDWFRDYVYIPLGGSRRGKNRTCFNITFVWLLTCLWHGANPTFFVWGLGYCTLLLVEKFFLKSKIEQFNKLEFRGGHNISKDCYNICGYCSMGVLPRRLIESSIWNSEGNVFC